MKKTITIVLVLVMIISACNISVLASEIRPQGYVTVYGKSVPYYPVNIPIVLNGKEINFDNVKPVNVKGRILVPLRSFFVEDGWRVEYNNSLKRIFMQKAGKPSVLLNVGDCNIEIIFTRWAYIKDVPPLIINNTTMLPLSELLYAIGGYTINATSQKIEIINHDNYNKKIFNQSSMEQMIVFEGQDSSITFDDTTVSNGTSANYKVELVYAGKQYQIGEVVSAPKSNGKTTVYYTIPDSLDESIKSEKRIPIDAWGKGGMDAELMVTNTGNGQFFKPAITLISKYAVKLTIVADISLFDFTNTSSVKDSNFSLVIPLSSQIMEETKKSKNLFEDFYKAFGKGDIKKELIVADEKVVKGIGDIVKDTLTYAVSQYTSASFYGFSVGIDYQEMKSIGKNISNIPIRAEDRAVFFAKIAAFDTSLREHNITTGALLKDSGKQPQTVLDQIKNNYGIKFNSNGKYEPSLLDEQLKYPLRADGLKYGLLQFGNVFESITNCLVPKFSLYSLAWKQAPEEIRKLKNMYSTSKDIYDILLIK